MDSLRKEIEEVKKEVTKLREDLEEGRAGRAPRRSPAERAESAPDFERRVRDHMAKAGAATGVGVFWTVITIAEGGVYSANHHSVWNGPGDKTLPTEEKIRGNLVVPIAGNPLVVWALHYLFLPFYDRQPMRLTRAALAAKLAVGEAELETQLRPLVANETLRIVKAEDGADAYELARSDLFLLLGTLGG
jgi:hypothetical protein